VISRVRSYFCELMFPSIPNSKMIKIILADDHHIVRKGIRLLVSEDPELEIVAEAANGLEVLEALEKHPDTEIILADVNMPVMDGYALISEMKVKHPGVKLIFLSMIDNYNIISDLLARGISGYLLKASDAMELHFGIRFVAHGSRYVSSELGIGLLETRQKSNEKIALRNSAEFSPRELEVLHLIAEGLTNAEIARQIFVSKRTVEGHRQSLLEKTGSKNTAVLIRKATLLNLI